MAYYADPRRDLPSRFKKKRVIFYEQGLKIYGQIPYILQMRLGAEFYSDNAPAAFGGRIIAMTMEPNYTVVPYKQSREAIDALLEWLYGGDAFEWAVAVDFYKNIRQWNALNMPAQTFVPSHNEDRWRVAQLLLTEGKGESCIEP